MDQWQGRYDQGWGKNLYPEAYSHPAKVSFKLAERIYAHAIENHWIEKGGLVLDPFGGICGFGFHAMANGLNFVAVELEAKFVKLGEQNIDLWHRQLSGWPNLGTARIIQGDSRKLKDVFNGADILISYPPYVESLGKGKSGIDWSKQADRKTSHPHGYNGEGYGVVIEKADLVVSSPPYAEGEKGHPSLGSVNNDNWGKDGRDITRRRGKTGEYGLTPGNLANLKEGKFEMVVGSPPYAESLERSGGIDSSKSKHIGGPNSQMNNSDTRYGRSTGQIGSLREGDFNSVIGKFDSELIEFFWSNIVKDECWEWTGTLHNEGYGQFRFKGKRYFSHRLSWEIHFGSVPKNLLVCHKCDNPKCVNPDHLFVGTLGDNWRDCCEKKRAWMFTNPEKQPRGEDQGSAKLTEEQVKKIYERYHAGGETIEGLAKEYGVSRHPIWTIIHKKAWNHVLGSMKEGSFDLCVSSPPYNKPFSQEHSGRGNGDRGIEPSEKGAFVRYGNSEGQLEGMKEGSFDLCVSSPNFPTDQPCQSQSIAKKDYHAFTRGDGTKRDHQMRSDGNLGNSSSDTFWSASREIVQQCFDLLKPNGHTIWVCKDYVKNKKRVPFSDRWLALCESVGFKLVCRHQAMLKKDHNQMHWLGEQIKSLTERKSFFRRNAEDKAISEKFWKKIDPEIQDEYIEKAKLMVTYKPTEKKIIQKAQILLWKDFLKPVEEVETTIDFEDVICLVK